MLINTNYNNLPDGYGAILINTSSKVEILAEKLVAIPARNNIKARDFWGVIWLLQQNTPINIDLINQKIIDHGIIHFKQLLSNRIEEISLYFEKQLFQNEMSRFLDNQHLANTVNKPQFIQFAEQKNSQTLTKVFQALYSKEIDEPEFRL
ncbi:MAG: nucleotidyl transferase AbiEii/AbiGii toxin family protein [Alteromonadaceae bacterium]|nr:nucleotidyl transferase AbiEii/AbiGii toxin family protein [Alteromonadaceae bacterium]